MGGLVLVAGAALGVGALASVVGAPFLRASNARGAAAAHASPEAATPMAPSPVASPAPAPALDQAPTEAPVVAVDALPHAKAALPAGKRTGRLSVASLPTSCILWIDGAVHGPTPMTSLSVGAGPHKLECVSANGKTSSATVDVAEGSDAHYQFALTQ
jgi:hypothetical protein